ncbi:helix-turn-helix domain-containing protein [Planotetraspora sp. GP83]|uniref:helix-turn-helix domain-containing protein n=1 Tax=Planotetraspora sp. GP83 TaxID=3156264 RepID=UPI0035127659
MTRKPQRACSGPPESGSSPYPAGPRTRSGTPAATRADNDSQDRDRVAAPGADGRRLYRVSEAMHLLSMSRTVIYEQIRAGRLRSLKQGRTRLIPASAITEYIALLEQEVRTE